MENAEEPLYTVPLLHEQPHIIWDCKLQHIRSH